MAVLLGAERSKAETEMMDALKFEQQLASIFIPAEERRSPDIFYNPMTISQLQRKYPAIDWINYIHRLLPTNVKVAPNENVIVHSPKYIEKFLSLISTTPLRTQANYAMWRAAAASVTYMNEEVRKVHSEFSAAILGKVQRQSRQKECIAVVSSVLGNAIGAMYIRRYFQEEAKAAAQEMVDDIGIAFLDLLDEANWMDARTRQKAKEKAWAMHSHIGYPQEHRDDKLLNSFYGKFQINDGSYLRNVLSISRTATDFAFGRLRSRVNKTEWLSHGRNSVVNAFYHPQENSILFPAAILQGHFFDTNRPKYMNYGAIGWVIGHEISHGFYRQGHQYDKNGDFRDWWDPSTKKTYQSRTQCFVQQYGNFVATDVQLRLNGENSEGENVADNGGIKEAYRGYGHWVKRNGPEKGLPGLDYTPNQLFWITAANNWCTKMRPEYLRHTLTTGVHAPGEFRVLGTFANSKEFAKDFNCPLNSRMNPALKCSLW
jgi:predicted metalloendopeptidase